MPTFGRLRPSLRSYLLGFVMISGMAASAILLVASEGRLRVFERAVLSEIAERRANAAATLFARALRADWRDVQTLAASVNPDVPGAARQMLDLVVGAGERIPWAGVVRLDGTITAASRGMLEGVSVADRPWFQRGLEGPYAGDVRDAKLLARLLAPASGEPPRFLDLSAPIPGPDGAAMGVVSFRVSHDWANAFLAETAGIVGVEAVLVNRAGEVVIGPEALLGRSLSLASFGASRTGSGGAFVEDWPDGRRSLSVVVPSVGYGDLPAFGWSLVARIDPDALVEARLGVTRGVVLTLLVLLVILAAATLAFNRIFLAPLDRIARTAEKIAAGADAYPHESRRSSELARLSGAIAKLQSRRGGSGDD